MPEPHHDQDSPAQPPEACELATPRVVFADDSATQRVLVGALLQDRAEVLAVRDGAEALAAIRATLPDVVISDLRMPELGGLELLAVLKADPVLRRIPFILVTGEEEDLALRTMDAGADDYIAKPFGPELLRARVSAAIRTSRMVRELERQHEALLRAHREARRLELELRQAQKLEAVGRLAAGIAHEINTPIQYIGDNARFLEDALDALLRHVAAQREALRAAGAPELVARLEAAAEELDLPFIQAQAPRAVERTLQGVERVARIVRAMKEFAHPDEKVMVPSDLNQALQATLEVARNEYKYVADVELALGDIPQVVCHASDLNQVFLNILVNAAQAIDDRVRGTGRRGRIRVATARDGEGVRVSVSDTGGGIPADVQPKVFEPFFTTKEVGRGTGQGLAISRAVVERHRGAIWFETTPGEGTTFHVLLPLQRPAHPAAPEAA